jgi:hypothetical protein
MKLKPLFLTIFACALAANAAPISTTTGLDANKPWLEVVQAMDNGTAHFTLTNPVVTGSVLSGYATTATAAGTTTLTVSSAGTEFFTGSTTQTVKLPVTSTLTLGQAFVIENNSTGAVTVQSSGANTVLVLGAATRARFTCIAITGTTASSWDAFYEATNSASGKVSSFSNSLVLAGTDGTTMTFPSTSATIARTDAANTFTGVQTMTSPVLVTPTLGAASATTLAVGAIMASDDTTYSAAGKGGVLKQGANGRVGTWVCNGATPVTISNTSVAISDAIVISLNTVGGTVGVQPHVVTITAGTGFTAVGTASDTSTYNYALIKNAP